MEELIWNSTDSLLSSKYNFTDFANTTENVLRNATENVTEEPPVLWIRVFRIIWYRPSSYEYDGQGTTTEKIQTSSHSTFTFRRDYSYSNSELLMVLVPIAMILAAFTAFLVILFKPRMEKFLKAKLSKGQVPSHLGHARVMSVTNSYVFANSPASKGPNNSQGPPSIKVLPSWARSPQYNTDTPVEYTEVSVGSAISNQNRNHNNNSQ